MNRKEVFSYYLAEEGDLILSCMIVVLIISPMEPMDVSHVRYNQRKSNLCFARLQLFPRISC